MASVPRARFVCAMKTTGLGTHVRILTVETQTALIRIVKGALLMITTNTSVKLSVIPYAI